MLTTLDDRIDRLDDDMKAIVMSLANMNDTLNTHTDMLAELLAATTVENDGNALADALKRLIVAVDTNNEHMIRITAVLTNMGVNIENAVIRGVHRAVGNVDEDGVVRE